MATIYDPRMAQQNTAVAGVAPLDDQAASDRASIANAAGTVKDVNQRVGAAIADVATFIPRGLAGAYDSAVVRPMRAAGINAGYVSPMLAPAGSDPGSQTPFYDRIRAQDAAAAPVAPPSTTPKIANLAQPANAGRGSVNPANVVPAPPDFTGALNSVPKELPSEMPGGVVIKTVDPKTGRVTYSGKNVGLNGDGQVQMTDGAGRDLKMLGAPTGNYVQGLNANGKPNSFAAPGMDGAVFTDGRPQPASSQTPVPPGGVGGMPGRISQMSPAPLPALGMGPISAQNMAAADALAARNDGSTEIRAAQNKAQYDQEVAAAQAFNQAQFDRNNPMTKAQLGTQALRLQQQQVQQSGAQQAASNQIAQARLGLDTATAGLDTRGRIQLLAAQDALTNAKTPEERAAAQSNLLSLQGKAREVPAQWKGVATAGSKNVDGSTNDGTVTLFNEQTGEVRQAGADKLPAGMARQVGTSGGKPVYEDASGKRFIGN